jgi:hypothetical protein
MAGSRRWFQYTLDDGTAVGIQADESNVEAVNGGNANVPASPPTRQAPKGTRLRAVRYRSSDGKRVITIPILTSTVYASIPASLGTISNPLGATGEGGGTLYFDSKIPEKVKVPKFAIDSGLTDDDTPG